jgi:FKBP-type peptidyl-prolyl cis-trans isomerase
MLRARSVFGILFSLSTLTIGACGSDSPTAPDATIETTTFAASLGVNLATSTKTSYGMYYRDIAPGTGAAAVDGKTVALHYSGSLTDGTNFETNGASDTPISFILGTGQVIPGWDLGIKGMLVGGQRQLIIPPSLAYGSRANGKIPANSILVFTVSLVSVK